MQFRSKQPGKIRVSLLSGIQCLWEMARLTKANIIITANRKKS